MPHKARNEHWKDLENVTTLAKAVEEYCVSKSGLTYAIDVQNIAAVRVGKAVLISRRSLDANYPRRNQPVK